jgi:PTS system mannose-specific IIA component
MNAPSSAQPVGVVIATHGRLSHALLNSAEMIVGKQDGVATVSLEPQDTLETFQAALNAAIDQVNRGAGVLVLIDLFGGTPGNATALRIGQGELPAVSGVNLPMLLEVFLARSTLAADALAALALESGAKGIVDITAKVRAGNSTHSP